MEDSIRVVIYYSSIVFRGSPFGLDSLCLLRRFIPSFSKARSCSWALSARCCINYKDTTTLHSWALQFEFAENQDPDGWCFGLVFSPPARDNAISLNLQSHEAHSWEELQCCYHALLLSHVWRCCWDFCKNCDAVKLWCESRCHPSSVCQQTSGNLFPIDA